MCRLIDWFVDTPVDVPPGKARLHNRAKAVYSAWTVIQAIYAVLFLNVGQSVSAAVHVVELYSPSSIS